MSNIELQVGSSVDAKVDAIVNAANSRLLAGGGVCGAIFNKAGLDELQLECDKIITNLGRELYDGEAVITNSYNISNCKKIIHTVGPDFRVTPNAFDKMTEAYYNSLLVLMMNNLHSISFPLISSGIFAGDTERPVYESAKSCALAFNQFTLDYPDYDIDVKLYSFLENMIGECEEAFNEILNKGKTK